MIQPQIQKRATEIEPFVVLVAVLFGSTLFGVMGAILAIPAAAAILITFNEWRAYMDETKEPPKKPGAKPKPKPKARASKAKPKPRPKPKTA